MTITNMGYCGQKRNYMDELHKIICEIENLKPEPEVCNVRCPPLGCPRGPCPGMCCYEGICDPCCVSRMPCCPPPLQPPRCCAPPCIKDLAKLVSCQPKSCSSMRRFKETRPKPCCTSALDYQSEPFCTTVPTCPTTCCPAKQFTSRCF